MQTWVELRDKMREDTRLRLDHFYRTSAKMPTLPTSLTDPESWSRVVERNEQDAKNGVPNIYEKYASLMINGTMPADMFTGDDDTGIGQPFIPEEQRTVRPQPTQPQPTQPTQQRGGMSDRDFWHNH